MVSFQCEGCCDVLKKPKLDNHYQRCHAPVSCVDCSVTFQGPKEWKNHTSCMTEAEKYQKSLYKGPKTKDTKSGPRGGKQSNGHDVTSIGALKEDVPALKNETVTNVRSDPIKEKKEVDTTTVSTTVATTDIAEAEKTSKKEKKKKKKSSSAEKVDTEQSKSGQRPDQDKMDVDPPAAVAVADGITGDQTKEGKTEGKEDKKERKKKRKSSAVDDAAEVSEQVLSSKSTEGSANASTENGGSKKRKLDDGSAGKTKKKANLSKETVDDSKDDPKDRAGEPAVILDNGDANINDDTSLDSETLVAAAASAVTAIMATATAVIVKKRKDDEEKKKRKRKRESVNEAKGDDETAIQLVSGLVNTTSTDGTTGENGASAGASKKKKDRKKRKGDGETSQVTVSELKTNGVGNGIEAPTDVGVKIKKSKDKSKKKRKEQAES